MALPVSENDMQSRAINLLLHELGYDEYLDCQSIELHNTPWQVAQDPLRRGSPQEVISLEHLQQAMHRLNDHLPKASKAKLIDAAIHALTTNRTHLPMLLANKQVHQLIVQGYGVTAKNERGNEQTYQVRYIHFDRPGLNHFMAVAGLPVVINDLCCPDLLLYVNGIPLVLVVLLYTKQEALFAYDRLQRYKRDIPTLFGFNAWVILAGAQETKVGSFDTEWNRYHPWQQASNDRQSLTAENGLAQTLYSMCEKTRLLDIVHHFVFFAEEKTKVIAQNHQYLSVNKSFDALQQRYKLAGNLGVLSYTQGDHPHLSELFFILKVLHRATTNYSFVVVHDRPTLGEQAWDIFERLLEAHRVGIHKANNPDDLRTILTKENNQVVFTLIQHLSTPKEAPFGWLSNRKNLVVLIDETLTKQHKVYQEHIQQALPQASYLALATTQASLTVAPESAQPLPQMLQQAIEESRQFLSQHGGNMELILSNDPLLTKIPHLMGVANQLAKSEQLSTALRLKADHIYRLYRAAQTLENTPAFFEKIREVYQYLQAQLFRQNKGGIYEVASLAHSELFKGALPKQGAVAEWAKVAEHSPPQAQRLDILTVDFEKVATNFHQTPYQYLALRDMQAFLQQELRRLLALNSTRIGFAQRWQAIVGEYDGNQVPTHFFATLKAYGEELRLEGKRARHEGLTEAELQVFDLLWDESLLPDQKSRVKQAAQTLLVNLKQTQRQLLTDHWSGDLTQSIEVKHFIKTQLFALLDKVYSSAAIDQKTATVYHFMRYLPNGGRLFLS
ncbi:type I restriction endonuclease [Microscilla marina]|uniref:type I site-specific deoxyribonuclease n=1 Tax=Microscilla marina ATCC 23134 TaxID=313606 RepID=A1ZCV9_MICM2|nr:type I restriction endonuclease [Microscilla marina]EAY31498.1 type I site-specific deoxyribonuclease HsdR, putative [Microscilla marina ATCC 23134]